MLQRPPVGDQAIPFLSSVPAFLCCFLATMTRHADLGPAGGGPSSALLRSLSLPLAQLDRGHEHATHSSQLGLVRACDATITVIHLPPLRIEQLSSRCHAGAVEPPCSRFRGPEREIESHRAPSMASQANGKKHTEKTKKNVLGG
jgi:hypothetical protein